MYRAIENIGDFKKGDKVPKGQAELWIGMYKYPPVALCDSEGEIPEESPIDVEKGASGVEDSLSEGEVASGNMDSFLDDYLARNANVVISSLEEDTPTKDIVLKLEVLEKSGKNRSSLLRVLRSML